MAEPFKVIARHKDTPARHAREAVSASGVTTRLPEELVSEQVQRLAVFSAVALGVWTFTLFLDLILLPALSDAWSRNWRAVVVEVCNVLGAVVMCVYLRTSKATPERKGDVGLAFMLVSAVGIAVVNAWVFPPTSQEIMRFSWTTILILTYSMIAPSTPRRMLMASLVAASLDPLAYWSTYMLGMPSPTALHAFVLSWPNYVCAVIAILPVRTLHRVGRQLREAQELGSYHLVELLGTGGMGEVWRAKHTLLARDAAIKLVKPELLGAHNGADARVALKRFEREAKATAALSSPHTIQLFDFGATKDGTFYYVMELLTGRDLETLVREFGPLPAGRAMYLLRQVCHSLADAHARGFVHRDVKPANIYVCRMGLEYDFVKVLDFGLVKTTDRSRGADTLATIDQRTSGTPAYMAPETILGESDVDRRADVYALGCVAYFLLTGGLVFEADTSMKMLMQHLQAQPVPPSQRTELPIPRALDDLVLACLQKDPSLRPQNASALFKMACDCQVSGGWDSDRAHDWWKIHVPEVTGPLEISAPETDAGHMLATR
jgi:serine/threonine-protein kinase